MSGSSHRDPRPAISDRALADRLAHRDEGALGLLYDRYGDMVYAVALRILGNSGEAEEIRQDVFVQAWEQGARYDQSRGSLGAWLGTMTRSRALSRLRLRGAAAPGREDEAPEARAAEQRDLTPGPAEAALGAELSRTVKRALGELPFLQRAAIEMAFFEGLTHAEIAARLEEPLGTVKTRIRRGMLKLRDVLRDLGVDVERDQGGR
jgi:RNA polymerase sigma-70 factor (ECF subfamily)